MSRFNIFANYEANHVESFKPIVRQSAPEVDYTCKAPDKTSSPKSVQSILPFLESGPYSDQLDMNRILDVNEMLAAGKLAAAE